ncbi:MAG: aminotransferase [Marinovum sp.]|nr:aminotransferase [Marinovum sp.]
MTFAPPVMEARRWIAGKTFSSDRPLINVSQAAPVDAPPAPLLDAMSRFLTEADTHLYGPVLGLPALRACVASTWMSAYAGAVSTEQVAITSGCNQAFAAAVSALCGEGDEVILPTPWYFNHKMWLDMVGLTAVPLPCGPEMLPNAEQAAALITPKTRAIALVSPNNPTGVEYPAGLMQQFFELAQAHGIRLIVDETYRDFDSRDGAPHGLFAQDTWDQTLVQLYSFSKAYRLTGHRVGAIVADTALLAEAEKFLDTVTICPTQLGQKSALWGMQNLGGWLEGERQEILARKAAIVAGFDPLEAQGWSLISAGAYFAWLEHPFDVPSNVLAQHLVDDAQVLALPGTMFCPGDDPRGPKGLRVAFANIDIDGIKSLYHRLAALAPPRAGA